MLNAFARYLEIVCGSVRKYDPNHLLLGIRFGGKMSDEAMMLARAFDVCSINVYEYEPTKQMCIRDRLYCFVTGKSKWGNRRPFRGFRRW